MARTALRVLGLAMVLGLLAPVLPAQEKGKDKDKDKEKTAEPKLELNKLTKLAGTLVSASSDKGAITISVPYLVPQLRGQPKTEHKNWDLMPAEDMKVRTANPTVVYDEKGKPRRATNKELKEMKGEGNLPGYISDAASLKANQSVVVYCTTPKRKAAPKKGEELDKDALDESKPHVRLILIVSEPRN